MDRLSIGTTRPLVPAERRRRLRTAPPEPAVVDLGIRQGAALLDVSEGGIGVQAPTHTVPGVVTSMSFTLPGAAAPVKTMGTVAWSDGGRMGLEFRSLSEQDRERVARWIAHPAAGGAGTSVESEEDAAAADGADFDLQTGARLQPDVQHVATLTGATGVALALDIAGAMVCVATWGNAPGLNTRLDPQSGLSGECVRTGEVVRCEDTESDPRTDRLLCRRLNLRSIVIVPVRRQARTVGVIEVFSNVPHAFESPHVALLTRVADLVANTIDAHSPGAAPTPAESQDQPAHPANDGAASPSTASQKTTIPTQSSRPERGAAGGADQIHPPAHAGAAPAARPPDTAPPRAPVAPALIEPAVPPKKTGGRRRVPPGLPQSNIFRRTAGGLKTLVRSALVVWFTTALLLGGLVAYRQTTRVRSPLNPGVAPTPVATDSGTLNSGSMHRLGTRIDDVIAWMRALAQSTPGEPQVLGSDASAPRADWVAQHVSGGQLLEKVEPVYPEAARKQRLQGPVILRVQIGKNGRVQRVEVLRGDPVLASAAKAAVRHWRYEPFRVDGQAIDMQSVVTVPFALPGP